MPKNAQRLPQPSWEVLLGRQLREARKKEGLSQEKLGRAVGLTREMIRLFESGKRPPRTEVLRKLVLFLDADLTAGGIQVRCAVKPPAHDTGTRNEEVVIQSEFEFRKSVVRVVVTNKGVTLETNRETA